MKTFTESVVEETTLQWLKAVGYKSVSGPTIAPGERAAERSDYGKVVLEERLRQALYRLNPDIAAEALEQAFPASGSSAEEPTMVVGNPLEKSPGNPGGFIHERLDSSGEASGSPDEYLLSADQVPGCKTILTPH